MPFRITLFLAALLLGACTVKTTVEVTASTPASVSHLYVTVKEIWFTTQADATSQDNAWIRKVLSDPVTLDLASLQGGSTSTLGTLVLDAGTYAQVRLVLADVDEDLADSADSMGLVWNNAVQYTDSNGDSHLVALELPRPGASLQFPVSIKLGGNSLSDALSLSNDQTANVVADIDSLRGLVILDDNGEPRAMLDAYIQAHDQSSTGTITGAFDLSGLSSAGVGDADIVVSAEVVDADNARHSIVKRTRLRSDGSFTLYPLPADDSNSTYDLVVQGPGIATLIITGVPLNAGETTTLQPSSVPLTAASFFLVNTSTAVYGDTVAGFHQTLPTNSKPYLIDSARVNPFGEGFLADLALSAGPLMYGAYNAGGSISFNTVSADEGLARYRLAGSSRWRARSAFSTVAGNTAGSSAVQEVTVPQPALPGSARAGSISGTVFLGTAGRYDALQVIVSRGGQIVDTANLGSSIGGNTVINFTIANLPAGTTDAVYELSVRAWNSRNPADTLARAALATPVDLRQENATGLSLQL